MSGWNYTPVLVWDIIKMKVRLPPDIVPELRIDGAASWDLEALEPRLDVAPPTLSLDYWTFKIWITF